MKNENPLPLFRPEVANSNKEAWLGNIVLRQPFSFMFYSVFAAACIISLLAFLLFGHYTQRVQVTGMLVPDLGLIKIQPPQAGIVQARHVREGQAVTAGQVLFGLSSELIFNSPGPTPNPTESHAAILNTLRARQRSLDEESQQNSTLAAAQASQLSASIINMESEIAQLEKEMAIQLERGKAADTEYQRNKQVREKGYISESALQKKDDERLDQQGRLLAMQRERLTLGRALADARAEHRQLALRVAREQSGLRRQDMELEQASVAAQSGRQFLVTAPQAGTVTAILAEPGQMVGNQTLLTILPAHAQLEAHLYVPSRAVGFIEPGQAVLIRYAAFPHQKFGQYQGAVIDVARTALSPQEWPAALAGGGAAETEGLYRVRVRLARQAVQAYGKPVALTAGMRLEAHILQDRRSLIEWLLAPLYSLKGRLA
ncbi:colicin V secretion protein CvaA [Duganella sp. HH105]|nr:colicin V secretion protein CvaA [Duganella sp. HH105]